MIGRSVWIIDENQRVYEAGQSAPVFAGYFRKGVVVGQNRQSWIAKFGGDEFRIDKKSEQLRQPHIGGWFGIRREVYWSELEQDVDAMVRCHALRPHLADRLRRMKDTPRAVPVLERLFELLNQLDQEQG